MFAARGDVPTSPVPSLPTRSWPPLRSAVRQRTLIGALFAFCVLLGVSTNAGRSSLPSTPPAVQHLSLPEASMWQVIRQLQAGSSKRRHATNSVNAGASKGRGAMDNDLRIMFMGDSITDGGAANTAHPRKHPNGSCSYRFSFLSEILTNKPMEEKHKLLRDDTRTVGPFSTNCGSDVIPPKCFDTLGSAPWWWGPSEGAAAERGRSRFLQHAATSGVTALGLMHHRETWHKREACFEKSGLLVAPPSLPPEVLAMEDAYRTAFPSRRNVSDVGVWAATYRPHLVVLLLGTNDLRWGRRWQEILFQSLASIVAETLSFAGWGASPLFEEGRGPMTAVGPPPPPPYAIAQHTQCTSFVAVSTLYPRNEYTNDIAAINAALLSMRDRRRRGGIACPTTGWDVGELLWLCHPCVRIVDGGAPVANGQRMANHAFVAAYTFDGLHPNDEGDILLGRRLAEEVMAS